MQLIKNHTKYNCVIQVFVVLFLMLGYVSCTNTPETSKHEVKTENSSIEELNTWIESKPTDAELYYRRGKLYFDQKDFEKALSDVNQAIDLDEKNALYFFLKGRVLYALNQTIEAAKVYEQAIQLNPNLTEAKLLLGELYYIVKEHKKSLDIYNSILATDPKNTSALFFKGMNYKEIGDTNSAIQVFQKAFEIDAKNYDAVMQLGNLFAGYHNKIALDYYITASRLRPKSSEPPYSAGVFYQQKKEYKLAIGMYKQALKADENFYPAYYNSSLINVELGQYNDAIQNLNVVIRIEPGLVDAYYMKGLCYEALNNKEEAKINYQYTLDLDANHALAKKALAALK
ncbi:MAG: tetratricopeptide repeat protein [Bacteroidia bacterium]|nr:tetratricopeptide repeat protein [Bacteroidia bacterium]